MPYRVYGPKTETGSLSGSGLYIFSKYPFSEVKRYRFGICRDLDCLSNKGIIAARVKIPGIDEPITIATAHFQAGAEFDQIREEQIQRAVMPFLNEGGGQIIFAGDFKTRPGRNSYSELIAIGSFLDVGGLCESHLPSCAVSIENQDLISQEEVFLETNDRHLLRLDRESRLSITPIDFSLNMTRKGKKQLSDHWGYQCHL